MSAKAEANEPQTTHILITQCLQNGFFLSDSNRLSLPEDEVARMLIGAHEVEAGQDSNIVQDIAKQTPIFRQFIPEKKDNRRYYKEADLQNGPLYRFLDTIINKPNRNSELHVIHIKDWHPLSPRYDEERRLYGGHCEANTWEADPIDGYEQFLKPWGIDSQKRAQAQTLQGYAKEGNSKVKFYEVLVDSVFDFKRTQSITYQKSIQELLDNAEFSDSHLSLLLDRLIEDSKKNVYVTVIGVYTDIKIKVLLMGLRSLYDINNLLISDVLTAAPSPQRQLEALDFISKVLNVEIVSDLNTIIGILDTENRDAEGTSSEENPIPLALTANSLKWRDYRNYAVDKQIVLNYQDRRLAEYLKLTTERSRKIYETLYNTNVFLTQVGKGAILLLLLFIIWNGILVNFPPLTNWIALGKIPLEVFVATGIGTFAQIIPLFFTGPQEQMQKNLMRLVRLQNYLENYSMASALLRYHLTTPNRFKEGTIEELEKQLGAIKLAVETLEGSFKDLEAQDVAIDTNIPNIPSMPGMPSMGGNSSEAPFAG